MSAAPGTGTATRAPAATSRASTTRTRSIPSSTRRGRGRRSTPRSRRSSATRSTSPTSTTCGATSGSRPGSSGGVGRRQLARGACAPRGRRDHVPLLRHGHRLPVDAEGGRHRGRGALPGRGVLHQPLAARGRRPHGQARRRDRHRLLGDPVDPAHRRTGGAADRLPAHAQLLHARQQRAGPRRQAGSARAGPGRVPRGRPLVPRRCSARGSQLERARGERRGTPGSLRGGVARRGDHRVPRVLLGPPGEPRRRTSSWPSSCAARSGPSCTTRRRPRRSARRRSPSAPSDCASTRATTRPSTVPHVRLVDLRVHPI